MTEIQCDILVIGAGPAGSMAALHAAKGNSSVVLVERLAQVGLPVRCGEGVGLKGFTRSIPLRDEWVLSRIKTVRFIAPNNTGIDLEGMGESYIIDRSRMDKELVDDAIAAGAKYYASTPITRIVQESTTRYYAHAASGDTFVARCVIIADGVESRLPRDLGWNTALKRKDIDVCAFAHVASPLINMLRVEFYTGKEVAPGGYLWVFPRENGQANVGLGVLGTHHDPGMARRLLLTFCEKKFPGALITDLHCGAVPVTKTVTPLVRDGAMLIGDSARQVSAINGAGIAWALLAGQMAGEIAAKSFVNGSLDTRKLKEYNALWVKSHGKQLKRAFALKEMAITFSDSFINEIAHSLSRENPSKLNYARVFARAFSRHPILLFKALRLFS